MEGLLNPVSTIYKSESEKQDALIEVPRQSKSTSKVHKLVSQASTPEGALEILKNEPDYDTLISTLRFLSHSNSEFNISNPGPLSSQILHTIVSKVLPDFWDVLSSSKGKSLPRAKKGKRKLSPDLNLLLGCLQNVTGLNAVVLSLMRHIQLSKETKKVVGGPKVEEILEILLEMLETLLEGDNVAERVFLDVWDLPYPPRQKYVIWKEFRSLVGGSKVIGIAAEAESIICDHSKIPLEKRGWISNSSLYSTWLARNIAHWAKSLPLDVELPPDARQSWTCCSELLSGINRLGHTDKVTRKLLDVLLLYSQDQGTHFIKLIDTLHSLEQRNLLYSIFQIISKDYFTAAVTTEANSSWWRSDSRKVSGAARLIKALTANELRKNHLLAWLTNSSGAGVGEGIAIRRATLAALAEDKSDIETILEKSIQQFGDKLYITHTPSMQQEAHAQVLLLSAGYVHRKSPIRFTMMMRSGAHLNAVSNRLATSSPRARFLGMVVGEALSSLVDISDKRMDFKVDEMSSAEGMWYKSLVTVADTLGSLDDMLATVTPSGLRDPKPRSNPKKRLASPNGTSKIISIEEIEADEEVEEDLEDNDLKPYGKLDSDPEDSDDDATNIVRNRPTAPVYIRDLITYLRNTDDYDRQKLGLATAAPLIRRKASFGSEVSTHAEELAGLLMGIQDKFEIEDFVDMRLQGLIAILVTLPSKMGPWFSKTFFDGDYSISQRASVLTTLGLGARELAGLGTVTKDLMPSNAPAPKQFPSKTLPTRMHNFYSPSTTNTTNSKRLEEKVITALSTQLQNAMIAPTVAKIADTATGPSILKIRTFSSRMAVEAARSKPTTNALAQIVSISFFFPLSGRYFMHAKANSLLTSEPFLLGLLVKTLALLLHASGPNTLSLPQMTSEFLDMLLGLRTKSLSDSGLLEALLFSFLTVLEVNVDKRRLVETHGREILEMQEWAEDVFSRLGEGNGEEEDKVRVLAAGVLVRIRECVEKYQSLLMGDLISFQ
ncbi:telomere length regulation protein-domain-containing protein [Tricladium varicosporioides]|nr:telomere length regulation protein-domain-containing protein [Hymenoscyphus varicosporioides]